LPSIAVATTSKKKLVKELKQPDQFVDFWTHAWTRIVEVLGPRKKPLFAGLGALLGVITAAAIFQKVDDDKKVEASQAFTAIEKTANAELDTATPSPLKEKEEDAPHFKTAAERQAAVLKQDEDFLAKYRGNDLKEEALVVKGGQLIDAGRYDEAIAAFDAAIAAKLDPRLRFLADEGKGYAYEGKGDFDKAAAAFAALDEDAKRFQGFYRDRAIYQQARMTERKGDHAGAVKLYKQVLDKMPDSLLHDEITDRLAVLEAK
jgi:tetratricopeptide (TPR) repeat protein